MSQGREAGRVDLRSSGARACSQAFKHALTEVLLDSIEVMDARVGEVNRGVTSEVDGRRVRTWNKPQVSVNAWDGFVTGCNGQVNLARPFPERARLSTSPSSPFHSWLEAREQALQPRFPELHWILVISTILTDELYHRRHVHTQPLAAQVSLSLSLGRVHRPCQSRSRNGRREEGPLQEPRQEQASRRLGFFGRICSPCSRYRPHQRRSHYPTQSHSPPQCQQTRANSPRHPALCWPIAWA